MKAIKESYKFYFSDRYFMLSFLVSIVILCASLVINFYAIAYATASASNFVTDIVLSNVRVFDVDGLFVYGTFVVEGLTAIVLLSKPQKIPFALKTLSLFLIIRSVFTVLTHIGPFPTETERTSYEFLNKLLFGSDSFFSAHTGMPYLGALVFWEDKWIRYLFLFCSVAFGIIVLLGHLHYSIDVLSAFFITYSIYKIAEVFFKKDEQFSRQSSLVKS